MRIVKKGQAAMEFLMTYGWAILVVLAAIGALAYFGVLSPQNLLPERTTFQAPLPNIDTAVVDNTGEWVEVAFRNNVGVNIQIDLTSAVFEFDGADATCTSPSLSGTHEGDAINASTIIANGDVFLLRWDCASVTGVSVDDRFKADASFDFTNLQTTQTRTHRGSIEGRW